jgi:predicted amidophosphoribosyltransferase
VNPTTIYLLLVVLATTIGLMALLLHRDPQRECPRCGSDVSMSARVCRTCQYRMSGRG